ncbi:hypothetical protein GGF43_004746, partial [Coemansia sp. RSA 2618]
AARRAEPTLTHMAARARGTATSTTRCPSCRHGTLPRPRRTWARPPYALRRCGRTRGWACTICSRQETSSRAAITRH